MPAARRHPRPGERRPWARYGDRRRLRTSNAIRPTSTPAPTAYRFRWSRRRSCGGTGRTTSGTACAGCSATQPEEATTLLGRGLATHLPANSLLVLVLGCRGRTITTGQLAWLAIFVLTEPSSSPA